MRHVSRNTVERVSVQVRSPVGSWARFLERELCELSPERGGGLPQIGAQGCLVGRSRGRFRGFRAFSRPESPVGNPPEPPQRGFSVAGDSARTAASVAAIAAIRRSLRSERTFLQAALPVGRLPS